MKMGLLLLIGIQVIVLSQITGAKDVFHRPDTIKYGSLIPKDYQKAAELGRMLQEYDRNNLRNLSDLWQSVKNSAKNAWNYIKNIANNAREKLLSLIQRLKDKANKLKGEFEEQIKKLQKEMNDLIDKIVTTGQAAKKCLKDNKESIDKIAKEIISNVTICISENILQLSRLENQQVTEGDETEFMNAIEDKLSTCVTEDVDEECLHEVRENMYTNVDEIEQGVLRSELETRKIADDVLNTIVLCSTEGLTSATANITMEVIKIFKCVSENEAEPSKS